MPEAFSNLMKQLDLEPTASDVFRGQGPGGARRRMFGGHVAAQAVVAAGRCTPQRVLHSLHLYFLRPGDPHAPVELRVERLRDGRSHATRLVRAIQHDELILHASVSFVAAEGAEGNRLVHQISAPVVPPPEACMTWEDWARGRLAELSEEHRQVFLRERPIEIRPVQSIDDLTPQTGGTSQQFWCRAPTLIGDDALLHQAVATYASDHTLLSASLRPHGLTFMTRGVMAASLDHAFWFHRPFRMDQWLLYSQEAPAAFGGRGLSTGHYFDQQGTLVASMAQEGVIRVR
jgi:acyl-CoA thioesterase II